MYMQATVWLYLYFSGAQGLGPQGQMVHVGQLTGPMIDPANNNRPLDFDTNKGKPPMAQHPQDMDERDNPMANTMRGESVLWWL